MTNAKMGMPAREMVSRIEIAASPMAMADK
jgi:hypothetical protein